MIVTNLSNNKEAVLLPKQLLAASQNQESQFSLATIPENLANILQSGSSLSKKDYEMNLAIEEIKMNNLND